MSDDPDEPILVAVRTDQIDSHVKGTRHGYRCSVCGCGLSLAPAGQKFVAENPATPVLCIPCAKEKCRGVENMQAQPAPGAIEELIVELIGRAKRHRQN